MNYLSREGASVSALLWEKIDAAVISAAKSALTGRRFIHLFGPVGAGVTSINIDDAELQEVVTDGMQVTKGRRYVEIPTLFENFTLIARDLESSERTGYPIDLSAAAAAAQACAWKEDRLLFFGSEALGYEGLLTAKGVNMLKRKDWAEGENAFADVSAAIETLVSKGIYGSYALALSPDLYMQLQRIQPGTGLLESERIGKLLDGRIFQTPALGKGRAVVVSADARNVDLVVGQDLATAYLEQKDLNHSFRVVESVLPRIKRRQAIVVFE